MNNTLALSDYMLILLDLDDNKPIVGAIRMMKMMFLFEKEIMPLLKKKSIDVTSVPPFIAYDFGPFSKDIYEQLELFTNLNFIKTTPVDAIENSDEFDDWEDVYGEDIFDRTFKDGYRRLNIDYRSLQYSITPRGDRFVSLKLLPNIADEIKELLVSFKRKICNLSTSQLLYYVYSRYEKYTTKSKIKDKVLSASIVMPEDSVLVDPTSTFPKDGDNDD